MASAVVLALLGLASLSSAWDLGHAQLSQQRPVENVDDIIMDTSMPDLVLKNGYPLEEYEVETEDGYLLTVFRIPHGKLAPKNNELREPILLQHGLLAASTCWVLSDPSKGLGFILADAGYDVWFGNSRGNTYSKKHKYLSPDTDKEKFWNFSFHEMGYYDLPAVVQSILNTTGYSKIHYVGHSQGTSQFFVFLSTRPEFNDKIASMSALAPVAFLDNARGTTKLLASLSPMLEWITDQMGVYDILSDTFLMELFTSTICHESAATQPLCDNLIFLLCGYDSDQLNETLIPYITNVSPAGSSIKQLIHYAQLMHNGNLFRQYDYGNDNVLHYNSTEPPSYELTNIKTPIYLNYADNDYLGTTLDVLHLNRIINYTSVLVRVPYDSFNHLDFLWAIDVYPLVYNSLINDFIKQHHITQ